MTINGCNVRDSKGTFVAHECNGREVISRVGQTVVETVTCECGCGDKHDFIVATVQCTECDMAHDVTIAMVR